MKTPYENRTKYGIDRLVFGKAKRKYRPFYWVLFLLYLTAAIIIGGVL